MTDSPLAPVVVEAMPKGGPVLEALGVLAHEGVPVVILEGKLLLLLLLLELLLLLLLLLLLMVVLWALQKPAMQPVRKTSAPLQSASSLPQLSGHAHQLGSTALLATCMYTA